RDIEDARVELLRSVVLSEGATLGVVAPLADLVVNLLADQLPSIHGSFQLELLGDSNGSLEDHPGHHLGVGVVATRSAALPDAVVRFPPDAFEMLDDRAPAGPEPLFDPAGEVGAEEPDADHLAVDVELELLGGGVADPNRSRLLVSGKLRQLELSQTPAAVDPVHDLDLRRVAGADSQQEVVETECLFGVAGLEQGIERP